MSIHSADTNQRLIISAPSAGAVTQGARTVGVLLKNLVNSATQVWFGYDVGDFSQFNLYFDGDIWESFQTWDSNFDISTPIWRWIVLTRGSDPGPVRAHVATYTASGGMTWSHQNLSGSRNNYNPITRFTIGDQFGSGFRGDIHVLSAHTTEMNDASVQSVFARSSAEILATSPQFFVHFPEASGASGPFQDIAGGGVEDTDLRTGAWTASTDPPNFISTLGRSGKPKTYSGSSWDAHPAKEWDGASWNPRPMLGYDGTDFIASK